MPNHVKPADVVEAAVNAGALKSNLPILDQVLRGLYSGFILGIFASLTAMATSQTGIPLVGALIFPGGFVMIVYYGFELVTGNMMVIPMAAFARKASMLKLLINLTVVWLANFVGTLLYVALFYGQVTYFGEVPNGGAIGATIIKAGQMKTVTYVSHGGLGWASCFFKAILCNFLVCFGVLGSLVSTSTTGKLVAAWIPVATFVALGFEHIVVNMFVIPCSMALGSGVTWGEWWGWNMVPVTLGNFVAAFLMMCVPMWVSWGHEYRKKNKLEAKLDGKLEDSDESPTTPRDVLYGEDSEAIGQDVQDAAYTGCPNESLVATTPTPSHNPSVQYV